MWNSFYSKNSMNQHTLNYGKIDYRTMKVASLCVSTMWFLLYNYSLKGLPLNRPARRTRLFKDSVLSKVTTGVWTFLRSRPLFLLLAPDVVFSS